jgi:preprotein translocase subunit SecF
VLKSAEADPRKKIRGAMKTGLTMIGATAAAMLALFVISTSSIITQIASVLLIGLIMDIPNTWILNSGLLLWYVERRRKNVKTTP